MILNTHSSYLLAHLAEHIIYRELNLFYANPSTLIYTVPGGYIYYPASFEDRFLNHLKTLKPKHLKAFIREEANHIIAEFKVIEKNNPLRFAYTLACHGESFDIKKSIWLQKIYRQMIEVNPEEIIEIFTNMSEVKSFPRKDNDFIALLDKNLKAAAKNNKDFEFIIQKYQADNLVDYLKANIEFYKKVFIKFGSVKPGHTREFNNFCPQLKTSFLTLSIPKGIVNFAKINDYKISPNSKENEEAHFKDLVFEGKLSPEDWQSTSQLFFGKNLSGVQKIKVEKLIKSQIM